jgi:hypothetical protein
MQTNMITVQQTIGVDQHGRHERSYVTSRLQEPPAQTGDPRAMFGRFLLLISLITGAVFHGYHLFLYPLYITDEGIYILQALQHATPIWQLTRGTISLADYKVQK